MAKQYLIVNDDQILVDAKLVFAAIRQSNGDWQQVEQELFNILNDFQGMIEVAEAEPESK